MLLSMTGYGAGQETEGDLSVGVEIRTVNNRYLKLHSRLPDGYAMLEPRMEEVIRKHIRRGAVQLNVDVRRTSKTEDYQINSELLDYYVQQALSLKIEAPMQFDRALLLSLPGVISDERRGSADADEEWPVVKKALEAALGELTKMRKTEGEAMAKDLQNQVTAISQCADAVEKLSPQVVEAYQTRVTDRINKMLEQHDAEVQNSDIIREVGIFAERVDIAEEVVRLRSHLDQFVEIMQKSDDGAGRKLEFFVQELLRETNTIGSKANNAEIARHVVDAKTSIERIREMVQNVE